MSLVGLLLTSIEFFWCTIMPIIGSLHLISATYKEDNSRKVELLRHWLFYWMVYMVANMLSGFLIILPTAINTFLRVVTLAMLASPKLGMTLNLYDYVQGHANPIIEYVHKGAVSIKEHLGLKEKSA